MNTDRLAIIASTLRSLDIPAWLLYSFRDSNPISARMLGLTSAIHQSRRWACLITADGKVRGLAHRIEPHIAELMPGEVEMYSTREEFEHGIARLVRGVGRVAMEYSPNNAIPVISRVDAGTVELVRSTGVDVESSGSLIAWIEGRLSAEQQQSALRAGRRVREVMIAAFKMIRERVTAGSKVSEFDVQRYILSEFDRLGMVTDHPPICAVGPNSANPHYEPSGTGSSTIGADDFVLIDLWARERSADSIFGDITWVGYVGETIPDKYNRIFDIVCRARDAALRRVREAMAADENVTGADLDDEARIVIRNEGFGEYFVHRTGHSITTELHGAGANLDNYETADTRPILPATSFSIEPGIYLPGEFGVRSELDVLITGDRQVIATSDPVQQTIYPIMARDA